MAESSLHQAVANKNIRKVQQLIANASSDRLISILMERNENGEIPLYIACCDDGNFEIVRMLLENHTAEQLKSNDESFNNTPLHVAASYGNVKIVEVVLRKAEAVSYLLHVLTEKNLAGEIPLHLACKDDRNIKIVKLLLNAKNGRYANAQLKAKNRVFGNTPFHVSAGLGSAKVFKILLNCTPHQPAAELDNENHLGDKPIHCAASKNQLRILKDMYNADQKCIYYKGRFDGLPLHSACGYGSIEVVQQLLSWAESCDANQKIAMINTPSKFVDLPPFTITTEDSKDIYEEKDIEDMKKKITNLKEKERNQGSHEPNHHYTPLTRACQFGHVKIVKILLEQTVPIKTKGAERHPLALIKAIEGKYEKCVQALLFYEMPAKSTPLFRKFFELLQYQHIPVDTPVLSTPFQELIKHMPDTAEAVLQKCTRFSQFLISSENFKIQFESESNALFSQEKKPDVNYYKIYKLTRSCLKEESEETDHKFAIQQAPRCGKACFSKEVHPLSLMVQYEREKLLKHPLVLSLIHDKWKKYGLFSFIYWFTYVIFMGIINYLLLYHLQNPSSDYCGKGGNDSKSNATGDRTEPKTSMIGMAVYIILYSIIRLVMIEFVQGIYSFWTSVNCSKAYTRLDLFCRYVKQIVKYFWGPSTWVKLALFPLAIAFAMELLLPTKKELPERNWQIGAIVVWLSWMEFIIISTQFRLIGVYAIMFKRVLMSLVKLIPLASLFIIGFSNAFHLILYKSNYKASPFYSVHYSFLKILSMTAGDLDTESFFGFEFNKETEHRNTTHLNYEGLSTTFWILALILMTVLLSNLLTGLVVDDIQSIYNKAKFEKLALQVEYLLKFENTILLKRLSNMILKWLSCCQKPKDIEPNNPRSKPLCCRICDELIYLLWSEDRCDSQESIEKLTKYEWPSCLAKKTTDNR